MKILAIESTVRTASAAIADEETILAEYTIHHKITHSQSLLPMIDEICRMTEQGPGAFDAVAAAAGPGSFTGLRIGAATAKGLGMAWNVPLVAVPTLDAMAYTLWGCGSLVCSIMDARRAQVYTALYRFDGSGRMERLTEAQAVPVTEILEQIRAIGGPVVFTGDGIPVFRDVIRAQLGGAARFAPPHLSRQRAGAVAALGLAMLQRGETVSAADFAPVYLRVSQAERERAERLKREEHEG